MRRPRRNAPAHRGSGRHGTGDGSRCETWLPKLKALKADLVIAVVDPSRKHEDSALWVSKVNEQCPISHVTAAPLGTTTLTPQTIEHLGYPVK